MKGNVNATKNRTSFFLFFLEPDKFFIPNVTGASVFMLEQKQRVF